MRTVLVLVAALPLLVGVSACASDSPDSVTSPVSSSPLPTVSPPSGTLEAGEDLPGVLPSGEPGPSLPPSKADRVCDQVTEERMSLDAAEALAEREKLPFRVVSEDGVALPATADFSENRVNFSTMDGVVVGCMVG